MRFSFYQKTELQCYKRIVLKDYVIKDKEAQDVKI